jgi:hypothetical protein
MSRSNWIVGLWICAAVLTSAEFVRAEKPAAPEAVLQRIGMFALGGIGVAGTMSEGERALREILKQPDALARLEALVANGSPAGKLYALLGLRIRDRAAYERALEKCRALDAKIETACGCMLSQESVRDLMKEIERGQWDGFLDRKWPENVR